MTNAGELAPHQADCALAVGGPPQKYSELLEERVRAHELAKYVTHYSRGPDRSVTDYSVRFFSASSITPGISRATLASKPRPAPDGTLTALAQLGVFRLDCERSFISLIDREYQYIIGQCPLPTNDGRSSLLNIAQAKQPNQPPSCQMAPSDRILQVIPYTLAFEPST